MRYVRCDRCLGTGRIRIYACPDERPIFDDPCHKCDGTGVEDVIARIDLLRSHGVFALTPFRSPLDP